MRRRTAFKLQCIAIATFSSLITVPDRIIHKNISDDTKPKQNFKKTIYREGTDKTEGFVCSINNRNKKRMSEYGVNV